MHKIKRKREETRTISRESKRKNTFEQMRKKLCLLWVVGLTAALSSSLTHTARVLKANDGNKHRGITSVHSRKADG